MRIDRFVAILAVGLILTGYATASENTMDTPPTSSESALPAVSLGYVILYVDDVGASLAFYEKAFGLKRRFFSDQGGKSYGELETGTTRLAFASIGLLADHFPGGVVRPDPERPPLAVEIALTTPNVAEVFAQAVAAGARAVSEPASKPWGQTVAYVRDPAGHVVEICSPMP